jgi:redox-sensitive bicupin YhaK (pirin superfamily)
MLTLRRSEDRGHAQHGWLESYHTFSFANYHDPKFTGFRSLLVVNEDRVQGGRGFGRHGHEDMVILSYVVEGALQHQDSLGQGSVLKPGDVQVINAGTGVAHSEFNASPTDTVHFLQIWIVPDERGLKPGYAEAHFSAAVKAQGLALIGSAKGREGSLALHQDVDLYAAVLKAGRSMAYAVRPGSGAWLQLISGALDVNGTTLKPGDGLAAEGEPSLALSASQDSEFLLFDLAV